MAKGSRTWMLWLAPLLFCITLLSVYRATQSVEEARRIQITSGSVDPAALEGRSVRLLCRSEQMTEVWLVAEAAAAQGDVFTPLEKNLPLIVSGGDPFAMLSEDVTIFSDNRFILEGLLQSTTRTDGVWLFEVDRWEIAYPIKDTLRPFFFDHALYPFDFKE